MEKLEEIKKLLGFVKNKDLAIFTLLQDIEKNTKRTLDELSKPEIPTDLSQTNELLSNVIAELKEPTIIRLVLD